MKILFVDDEIEILSAIKRQFRKENFISVTCNSAKEALNLLKDDEFSVIISDERMPEISGLDLMKTVKELYPNTIRIILSGYADSDTIIDAINMGEIYRFISKPWRYDNVINIITDALNKWTIEKKNRTYMEQIIAENRRLKMHLSFRGSSLNLDQNVIDEISVPMIAIGKTGNIEEMNSHALESFSKYIRKGEPITHIIPESFYNNVKTNIKDSIESGNFCIELYEIKYTVYIRALRPSDPYMGLILFERI